MKILKLQLENFRAIKSLTLDFDGHDADIFGTNGTGKTTIANAISWLFTDLPATDEKDFTPKTEGAHNLRHEAEITVEKTDGEQMTFAKSFYEKWTKKRGASEAEFTGHTIDYAVNGVPAKKKEYDAAIEAAAGVSIEQIKMLTLHGYFLSIKTEKRREVIFELCGDVTDDEVKATAGIEGLNDVLKRPGTDDALYSIDEYRKIAAEQRRKLNKDLDVLPARIDEAARSLPEHLRKKEEVRAELSAAKEILVAAQRALTEEQETPTSIGKQAEIAKYKARLEAERAAYDSDTNKSNEAVYRQINEARADSQKTTAHISDAAMEVSRLKRAKETMQADRKRLLAEYESVQAEIWDEHAEVCPTCGRELPEEQVEELREEFNRSKSQRKEDINRRGKECSQTKIAELDAQIEALTAQIAREREVHDAAQEQLKALEARLVTRPPFEETENCRKIREQIRSLENAQEASTAPSKDVREAEESVAAAQERVDALLAELASVESAERTETRMEELRAQQKEKSSELDRIEYGLNLCDTFTRAKARMITEQVNQHFKGVRWQLFKEQINGGLEQVCNPLVPNEAGVWVEYKSANTAAQVNAGLEIIDVLNTHYGTCLPVLLDQAESVCKVVGIKEQIIRLIVSEADAKLRVAVKEDK